jgi:hypothetical protein
MFGDREEGRKWQEAGGNCMILYTVVASCLSWTSHASDISLTECNSGTTENYPF